MSIRVMTAVWDTADASGTDLLALLALADWCNDEGRCWPSYATLATKLRTSRGNAIRIVGRLEEAGHLRREHRKADNGDNRSNVFVLERYAARVVAESPPPGSTAATTLVAQAPPPGSTAATQIRQENRQEETSPDTNEVGTAAAAPHWAAGSETYNAIADELLTWMRGDVNPDDLHPATRKMLKSLTRTIVRDHSAAHVKAASEAWFSKHWAGKDKRKPMADRRPRSSRQVVDWIAECARDGTFDWIYDESIKLPF